MANTIRIKRRTSGTAGAPSSLANAELAFNELSDILYYGEGGTASAASSIIAIGGSGAFSTLGTAQTITGNKTFSGTTSLTGTATATTQSTGDNSTKLATTAYVDNALTTTGSALAVAADSGSNESIILNSETLTIAGGTGLSSATSNNRVTVNLDATAVTQGSYGAADAVATFTVDAQGRLTAAADSTINILASAVSDFDTQVQTNSIDQLATPGADVSINSFKLTDVADPTAAQDAATKNYVDSVASGLDVKDSCRVATTGNINLTGTQTIDGVSVVAGDRVLVKDQTTGADNGIYVCDSSTWSRATDADSNAEVTGGMFTFVEEGTTNADAGFVLTTNNPITLNTTSLAFAQFSGAGQISAGNGLTKTGNTIDAVGTSNRISVSANAIDIDSAYVGQTSITTLGTVTTGDWNSTNIAVLYGGTGASNASGARTNLGLVIGTDVQAYDAELDTLSGMNANAATALAALTEPEIQVIDGTTSATSTTLELTDSFVVNDAGSMVQVALSDLVTFFEDGSTSGFDVDGGTF